MQNKLFYKSYKPVLRLQSVVIVLFTIYLEVKEALNRLIDVANGKYANERFITVEINLMKEKYELW